MSKLSINIALFLFNASWIEVDVYALHSINMTHIIIKMVCKIQ